MLYRLASIGIALFWLVMMALLIRLETHPDDTDILDVPVSYVARVIFRHAEPSVLSVTQDQTRIGTLSFRPAMTGTNGRTLDFSGVLTMQLPVAGRQKFDFNGTLNMDAAMRIRDFHAEVMFQASHLHLDLRGDAAKNTLRYETRAGNTVTAQMTLPMNAKELTPALLQHLGLPPNAIPVTIGDITPPKVAARETTITVHGEQLQVYEMTVTSEASQVADLYVTELGQIVLANTNFGWSLAAEDYQ